MYTLRLFGKGLVCIGLGGMVFFSACEYPLHPAGLPSKDASDNKISIELNTGGAINMYKINGDNQTCNPSPAGEDMFADCMAWLNLKNVLVNETPSGFSTDGMYEHDRIIVSDTNNNVVWYLMADAIDDQDEGLEIQDPEWGAHPYSTAWNSGDVTGYMAFLGEDRVKEPGGNKYEELWDGYIVRMADKVLLRFANDKFNGNETPHIWVGTPPSQAYAADASPSIDEANSIANEDGTIALLDDAAKIRSFFGTDSVKLVWADDNGIQYIDYSAGASVQSLDVPDSAGFGYDSPLISPDGEWVAYNFVQGVDPCIAVVQKLSAGSTPVYVDTDVNTCEPHWWKPDTSQSYYLVYNTGVDKKAPYDSHWKKILLNEYGITVARRIGNSLPASATVTREQFFSGDEVTLLGFPFIGGINKGGYVCTGYQYSYLAKKQ
jgi:hypothetical protein